MEPAARPFDVIPDPRPDDRVWPELRWPVDPDLELANGTVWLARPVAGIPAGSIVGTTSYLNVDVAAASVEIGGTAYTPAVWGTAVNPACKLLLLTHASDVLRAGRVQIKTDVRNERSQRAIARLGATFEGVLRRQFRRDDGTVRDTVMFSIIAEDWPSVRDGLRARLAGG